MPEMAVCPVTDLVKTSVTPWRMNIIARVTRNDGMRLRVTRMPLTAPIPHAVITASSTPAHMGQPRYTIG